MPTRRKPSKIKNQRPSEREASPTSAADQAAPVAQEHLSDRVASPNQVPSVGKPVSAKKTPSGQASSAPKEYIDDQAAPADRAASAQEYSRNDTERIRSRVSAQRKQAHSRRIWIAVAIAIVVLGIATAVLAWNQWFAHDDAADFQGEWTVVDSGYEVTITADKIYLTTRLGYDYHLDTFSKTLSFSYEDLSGKGTYVFSSDRNTLTIAEVGETSSTGDATTLNTVLQRKGTTKQTSGNG